MSTTRKRWCVRVAASAAVAGTVTVVCTAAFAGAAAVSAQEVHVELMWERSLELPEGGLMTGVATDLNGDGLDEVLLHCGRRGEPSCVVALAGWDGRELWRTTFPRRSCMLAIDIDGGDGKEVVAACGGDLSVVAGTTGASISQATLGGVVGDLSGGRLANGDRFIACTVEGRHDDRLIVLAGDGLAEAWSVEAEDADGPFATGFTYPSALDVDGDGLDEVVAVENGNRLLCFSAEGELRWDVGLGRRERLNPEGVVSARPVLTDLLGDGLAELVVGCFAGAVVSMDARTGQVLDRVQFGMEAHEEHLLNLKIPGFIRAALGKTGEPVNCLTAAELDGGPGLELVLGCSDGSLYALDPADGTRMWSCGITGDVYDPCVPVRTGDDGTHDLVVWDVAGAYLLDGATGRVLGNLTPASGDDTGSGEAAGVSTMLAGELDGLPGMELIQLALSTPRISAWRLVASACGGGPE